MSSWRQVLAIALPGVLAVLGGCGATAGSDREPAAPATVTLPGDLVAYFDQPRTAREGRSVVVRLVHEGEGTVTALRAELRSDRFGSLTWTGEKTFTNEADLDLELGTGRCGTGSDAQVALTYRLDGGPELVSTTRATDRYGAVALLLDRDCAQQATAEAADLAVGEPRIVGSGDSAAFELPVTLTGTGGRDDVAFSGFGSTVLFTVGGDAAVHGESRPVPLAAGRAVRSTLALTPARCDPHALAEDKVGTLFPVYVEGPGLPAESYFYLPLGDATRGELRGFFADACGL